MNWEPWNTYEKEIEILPIAAPPCQFCEFWKPQRIYEDGRYAGVKLCHADEMHFDFSCYRKIKTDVSAPDDKI